MGMSPYLEQHAFVDDNELNKFIKDKNVRNIIPLGNNIDIVTYINYLDSINDNTHVNSSIGIAAAITAEARVYMSKFLISNNYKVFYHDTDSMVIDRPLDPKFIGDDIGLFKLEHVFKDAIFLSPKVYAGITDEYEYVKIKGLKNTIHFNQLKTLFNKDSKFEINQEKWYKNLSAGEIRVVNEVYTLIATENKKNLLFLILLIRIMFYSFYLNPSMIFNNFIIMT